MFSRPQTGKGGDQVLLCPRHDSPRTPALKPNDDPSPIHSGEFGSSNVRGGLRHNRRVNRDQSGANHRVALLSLT